MSANRYWIKFGAALGFVAVAMGAFGAHALKDHLIIHEHTDVYQTASKYALVHAVLIVTLAIVPTITIPRSIFMFLVVGICIFSGTLWCLTIFQIKWLGAVTPIGGLCLLFGWARLGWFGLRL